MNVKATATVQPAPLDQTPSGQGNSAAQDADDDAANVPFWPDPFDCEPADGWTDLNSSAAATTTASATASRETTTTTITADLLARGRLRVFCGTWNLEAKTPPRDLRAWLALNKYHVVAIGTEECVHSIAKSVVFTSKKQWEHQLRATLGDEYVKVASHALTAIHNIVFVHESVLPLVRNVRSDAVATGLGNQIGNKGGVGISLCVGETNLAFVNCHFDAHQHQVDKRNANFHKINTELDLVPLRFPHARGGGGGVGGPAGVKRPISESFDRVFWYGDLNYRINGTRTLIDKLLLHDMHAVLVFNDQLKIDMQRGNVFKV